MLSNEGLAFSKPQLQKTTHQNQENDKQEKNKPKTTLTYLVAVLLFISPPTPFSSSASGLKENFQSCFCCNSLCELAQWNESQQSHRNKAKGSSAERSGTLGIPAHASLTETGWLLLLLLIPPSPSPKPVRKCSLPNSSLQLTHHGSFLNWEREKENTWKIVKQRQALNNTSNNELHKKMGGRFCCFSSDIEASFLWQQTEEKSLI